MAPIVIEDPTLRDHSLEQRQLIWLKILLLILKKKNCIPKWLGKYNRIIQLDILLIYCITAVQRQDGDICEQSTMGDILWPAHPRLKLFIIFVCLFLPFVLIPCCPFSFVLALALSLRPGQMCKHSREAIRKRHGTAVMLMVIHITALKSHAIRPASSKYSCGSGLDIQSYIIGPFIWCMNKNIKHE